MSTSSVVARRMVHMVCRRQGGVRAVDQARVHDLEPGRVTGIHEASSSRRAAVRLAVADTVHIHRVVVQVPRGVARAAGGRRSQGVDPDQRSSLWKAAAGVDPSQTKDNKLPPKYANVGESGIERSVVEDSVNDFEIVLE